MVRTFIQMVKMSQIPNNQARIPLSSAQILLNPTSREPVNFRVPSRFFLFSQILHCILVNPRSQKYLSRPCSPLFKTICTIHYGPGRTRGQNCFCYDKISDKCLFPVNSVLLYLGSHAICIPVIHALMCQQKETFMLPLY